MYKLAETKSEKKVWLSEFDRLADILIYVNGFMGKMQWGKSVRLETGVYRVCRIPCDQAPDFSSDFAYYYDGALGGRRCPAYRLRALSRAPFSR